jgi:hypothetical protein
MTEPQITLPRRVVEQFAYRFAGESGECVQCSAYYTGWPESRGGTTEHADWCPVRLAQEALAAATERQET